MYVHAKSKFSTSNNLSTFRRLPRSSLEACDCFSWSRRHAHIHWGWTPLSGSERPCAWWCWMTPSLAEAESGRIQLPHSAQSCDCPPHIEWPCQGGKLDDGVRSHNFPVTSSQTVWWQHGEEKIKVKHTCVNAQKGVSWYHDWEEEVYWQVHKHNTLLRCNQESLKNKNKTNVINQYRHN